MLTWLLGMQVGGPFMSFQWDILLLEVGVAAIAAAPLWPTSQRAKAVAGGAAGTGGPRPASWLEPMPIGLLLQRFILFKLMLMSGVVKVRQQVKVAVGQKGLHSTAYSPTAQHSTARRRSYQAWPSKGA